MLSIYRVNISPTDVSSADSTYITYMVAYSHAITSPSYINMETSVLVRGPPAVSQVLLVIAS